MPDSLQVETQLDTTNDARLWQRFSRNLSITVVGSVLTISAKLIQAFLLTRFLKIDDYGRFLIVTNFVVFLNSLLGFRVNDAIFRFFQPLKEEKDFASIRRLLLTSFGLSLMSCVVLLVVILACSGILSSSVYHDPDLSVLFRLIAITLLVSSFSGIYESILRLHDRFSFLLASQVVGSAASLVALSVYLLTLHGTDYDLRVVVGIVTGGILIQGVPPLIKALKILKPYLDDRSRAEVPKDFTARLISCFVYSNLSGYLKFATSPGDIFLLGIFASPVQVAWYGLAKQLASPLSFLEVTIQTAVTPEIVFLRAKHHYQRLKQLVSHYLTVSGILGGILLTVGLVLGRLLFTKLLRPGYADALPVFYCLLLASTLLTVLLVFRPLAVALDQLKWHNLMLLVSVILVVFVTVTNQLSAMTMALIQLNEAVALRPAFALFIWYRLRNQDSPLQVHT
jgi:O-antigen/teichoic acid export membrane protein